MLQHNPFKYLCFLGKQALILACVFSSGILKSQNYYTTDPDYIRSKREGNNLLSEYRAEYPDTSITEFHRFFPRNILGNTGLASHPLFLKYGSSDLGFRYFDAPTQLDRILVEDIQYHQTKGPYADLTGIAGSKQLQIFKANFTHTFKNRIQVGFKLNRYNSIGYYNKQQTFANNLLFTNAYISKKKRFGYYGYALANLNKNRENGGIRDSVLNDSTVFLNKGLLAIQLDSAARENREFKVQFQPWFRLNNSKDSQPNVLHLLSAKAVYTSHKYRYKDQGVAEDGFYESFYYDTLLTNDSSHAKKFSNVLEYSFLSKSGRKGHVGFKSEYNRIWQKTDSVFYNHGFVAGMQFRKNLVSNDSGVQFNKELNSSLDLEYIVLGSNGGNFKVESKNSLGISRLLPELSANLLFERRKPDHIYNSWHSNHFFWDQSFKDVQQFQAQFGLKLGKSLGLNALYQNVENYLFFDSEAHPKQNPDVISNLAFSLKYSRLFFKHVGLSLQYIHQQSSNANVVRLPQHNAEVNVYYYASLFKNNMQVQLGTQVEAYQSFETYAYMPATQIFHLQNGFATGNFPFVDVYLNARIRPASFFLKIENVLAGIAGNNFALTQGYYQVQRAFRFGLKWMFFD